jgi:hypothetical protein
MSKVSTSPDGSGRNIRTVTIVLPGPIVDVEGQRQVTFEVSVESSGPVFAQGYTEHIHSQMGEIPGDRFLNENSERMFEEEVMKMIRMR